MILDTTQLCNIAIVEGYCKTFVWMKICSTKETRGIRDLHHHRNFQFRDLHVKNKGLYANL